MSYTTDNANELLFMRVTLKCADCLAWAHHQGVAVDNCECWCAYEPATQVDDGDCV